MMDRRTFLAALAADVASARAALAVAGLGTAAGCSSPRGATEEAGDVSGERFERVGIQLYTVRDLLARDFDGTLAQIAAIGYRDLEFAGYSGRQPEAVRAALERHRLRGPSVHVPLDQMRRSWAATVDAAHTIDHDFLIVPWLDEKERRTIADYERLADELNRLGDAARKADLRLGYHNHDFEFTPIGGQIPYDVLLDKTDPEDVAFEMDLYWITKAGHDPLAYFDRYPGRFPLVHVKDSAGGPEHRQTAVGGGSIDFKRIFARRKQAGIEHAFVEQDNPGDAIAAVKASYGYLSRLTF